MGLLGGRHGLAMQVLPNPFPEPLILDQRVVAGKGIQLHVALVASIAMAIIAIIRQQGFNGFAKPFLLSHRDGDQE